MRRKLMHYLPMQFWGATTGGCLSQIMVRIISYSFVMRNATRSVKKEWLFVLAGAAVVSWCGCGPEVETSRALKVTSDDDSEAVYELALNERSDIVSELLKHIEYVANETTNGRAGAEYKCVFADLLAIDPRGDLVLPRAREWLCGSDFRRVRIAREIMEYYERRAVPTLIELVGSNEVVVLTHTGGFVYVGAAKYYGHSLLVNYDIDVIGARAAWVLETITFQDFGFRCGQLEDSKLSPSGAAIDVGVSLQERITGVPPGEKIVDRQAVERARRWWDAVKVEWTRMDGLIDALQSASDVRQRAALEWIGQGRIPCPGFNPRSFKELIRPHVVRLRESGSTSGGPSVREKAEWLLDDDHDGCWWWRWKMINPV